MATVIAILAGIPIVLVGGVLGLAATKPSTFRVKRSATIDAAPEKVFPLINDFHNWPSWSPWEKMDPALKRTFSGAESGKGAVYHWEGNKQVGEGQMEITESAPGSKVLINLDFIKPFKANNAVEFTITNGGSSTNVTWDMHGPAGFMHKVMHVFMDMESMIGKDFDAGLASIKQIAEG